MLNDLKARGLGGGLGKGDILTIDHLRTILTSELIISQNTYNTKSDILVDGDYLYFAYSADGSSTSYLRKYQISTRTQVWYKILAGIPKKVKLSADKTCIVCPTSTGIYIFSKDGDELNKAIGFYSMADGDAISPTDFFYSVNSILYRVKNGTTSSVTVADNETRCMEFDIDNDCMYILTPYHLQKRLISNFASIIYTIALPTTYTHDVMTLANNHIYSLTSQDKISKRLAGDGSLVLERYTGENIGIKSKLKNFSGSLFYCTSAYSLNHIDYDLETETFVKLLKSPYFDIATDCTIFDAVYSTGIYAESVKYEILR